MKKEQINWLREEPVELQDITIKEFKPFPVEATDLDLDNEIADTIHYLARINVLGKEIERLNKENKELKEQVVSAIRVNNIFTENKSIIELQAQRYEQELTITKEKQLKERIEYLERSNNRREDEILELRQENADLDNIINELEKDLIEYFKKEYPDRKLEDYNLEYCTYDYALVILGKLQELKGDSSNE